jgi:hypothetical protein
MKHTLIATAALAALMVSPAAFAGKKQASIDAAERASAQAMVDASMAQSLNSIERSLDVLVGLSRGGEPPRVAPAAYGNRAPNPLAVTVAGAARQVTKDARVNVAPVVAPPATTIERDASAAREAELNSALSRRVDVSWNGSAYDLLASLASQINYSFAQGSTSVDPGVNKLPLSTPVKVSVKGATVRDVLQQVAQQVDSHADVFVSVPQRSISLLRK